MSLFFKNQSSGKSSEQLFDEEILSVAATTQGHQAPNIRRHKTEILLPDFLNRQGKQECLMKLPSA